VANVREPFCAQEFPPLPSAEERKRERQAQAARLLFFADQRKASKPMSKQEEQAVRASKRRERASPKNRGKRGVAKQQRIKELQRKLAKRKGEGVEEEPKREAEEGEGVMQAEGVAGEV
jgi:hypothetical protein